MAQVLIEERMARLEGRVDGFDARFDSLDRRMDGLERRMDTLGGRMDLIDAKIDRFREDLSGMIERNLHRSVGVNVALWSTILVALIFRN